MTERPGPPDPEDPEATRAMGEGRPLGQDPPEGRPLGSDPEATRAMGGQPPPPPPMERTEAFSSPPPGGRRNLFFALAVLAGFVVGLIVGLVLGGDGEGLATEDFVLFEPAGSSLPVAFEGGQFTISTFDEERGICDPAALKRFLRADRHRFDAWLELQGISEAEFDDFVDRLQTAILTVNTAVTNHACFAEGEGECPVAFHSVLEEGTPVWYDPEQDRIVAKCACSNPLKPPVCPPNCLDRPTPVPTPTPTPEVTPTPTPPPSTPTPTPEVTPTPTPEETPTPTPEETPTPTPDIVS